MKHNASSPEEKAELALGSFEGIHAVEVPSALEAKMLARFENEFPAKSRTPKWFWAAAVLLLAINITAAVNYSKTSIVPTETPSTETKTSGGINSFANEFFQGGNDIYSN